jgi:hypothetical protein
LADLSICGFPFRDVNCSDIVFLQKSTNFIAGGVMKQHHGSTCGLFVFQLWFQVLLYGSSDITVVGTILFEDLLKVL